MDFIPVRIGTLRPGDPVNFDIYIMIGDHYTHYIRTSDSFDPDRIEKLRTKGVKKLYIPEDSESAYLKYLDAGLDQLQSKTVPAAEKAALVGGAMVTEAENALHNVETESGYKRTEDRVQKMVDFLISDVGAVKNILQMAGCALDNFQHSANVASLSLGMATKLGIAQPRELLNIGLAALLHDAGLAKLGFSADVDPSTLSVDQLKKYQEHPNAVAHVLAGKPYINKEILELIANHEEIGNGVGFPNKKRIASLPLSSQILNLCNAYDMFSMKRNLPPVEAMKVFFSEKLGLFDLEHIKILTAILK